MKHIAVAKDIVEIDKVSWNDLEQLKPMQTLSFNDFESWELIAEWAKENKDHVKEAFMSWQWGKNLFFYVDYRSKQPWHKPMPLSKEHLIHLGRRGDYLTIDDVIAMGKEEMREAKSLSGRAQQC